MTTPMDNAASAFNLAALISSLKNMQTGQVPPNLGEIQQLANQLGLDIDWKVHSGGFAEITLEGAVKLKDLKLGSVEVTFRIGH